MSRRFTPTLDDPPLQEILYRDSGDPWRVAVACILLNRTGRDRVNQIWPALFDRYPVSGALAYLAPDGHLEELLRPLGLPARAGTLRRMSHLWTVRPAAWRAGDVTGYPGLGGYAQDAHDIIVLGRLAIWPEDRVLREWVRLLRETVPARRPLPYRAAAELWRAERMAAG